MQSKTHYFLVWLRSRSLSSFVRKPPDSFNQLKYIFIIFVEDNCVKCGQSIIFIKKML